MKKRFYFYIILLLVPLILSTLSVFSFFNKGLVIFPGKNNTIGVYSDTSSKVFNFNQSEEKIELEYMLTKGKQYPFTGIYLNILEPAENEFLDVSGYSSVEIKIQASESRDLRLYFLFYVENFTNRINYQSYRYLEQSISLSGPGQTYSFPLKNFETSLWWYSLNNTSEEELGKPDFKHLARIQIENGVVQPPLGKRDQITLEVIAFKKSYTLLYISAMISLLLALVIIVTDRINQRNRQTVITYKPLELENPMDSDNQRVVNFITNNYSNPELGMELIYTDTGITPAKISALIKTAYNLSFKQFLNNIRLAEAKRLLVESEYQIIEIAFKVGYNTVSHFNRLFKKIDNLSPKEYRKIHHK